MADLLTLVLAAFAVYRVAHMLALEDGPFDVFAKVRTRLGGDTQATWLGRGVNCPLCIGFWIALAASLIFFPLADWRTWLLTWLGIAGAAVAIEQGTIK